ncbi:MAG: DUF5063 domain-containing protein [Bacteroidales bacterium]|nr:DUF5063 domain-containing protein [Bacteroidales bacterium]
MDTIFEKNTIEFVTVSNEYCAFVEKANKIEKSEFVTKLQKILPLLYLKATMLPTSEMDLEEPEVFISEYDYDYIKNKVSNCLAASDAYISIFNYSNNETEFEQAEISECVADIYQDIKNFIENFKTGSEDAMKAALAKCENNFKEYWGFRLLSLLNAIHVLAYSTNDDDFEDDFYNEQNFDENSLKGNNLINNFFDNYHKQI